jgi:hypothetical protein
MRFEEKFDDVLRHFGDQFGPGVAGAAILRKRTAGKADQREACENRTGDSF